MRDPFGRHALVPRETSENVRVALLRMLPVHGTDVTGRTAVNPKTAAVTPARQSNRSEGMRVA
eukprot:1179373-Prorocentrum_minimum.AAC.4